MTLQKRQCSDPKNCPTHAHKLLKREAFKNYLLTKKHLKVRAKCADCFLINYETVCLRTCHKNLWFKRHNRDYVGEKLLCTNIIVGTKRCVWEGKTEQGVWDQVILVNANRDKTGGYTVRN